MPTLIANPAVSAIVAAAVAAFAGVLLTPAAMRVLTHFGVVDRPDRTRKLHLKAVPVGGGISVLAAMLCGCLVAALTGNTGFPFVLLSAGAMLSVVGLVDDATGLRGRQKLLCQIVIAAYVVIAGEVMMKGFEVFDFYVSLGVFGPLFAVLWIVGTINAINLLDGADGLASIVGITLGGALVTLCILLDKPGMAVVPAAMVGSLIGFLPYNLPPARVFLGDTGSQLIGLILGSVALQASLKGPTTLALTGIVAVWTVPIFDVGIAVARRRLTGRSMYTPDRGHLHHRLIDKGLSGFRLLAVVGGACLLTALGAVVSVAADSEFFAIIGVIVVLGTFVGFKLFGHSEVALAARRSASIANSLVRRPHRQKGPVQWESRLRGTGDWEALWGDLRSYAERFALVDVHLSINVPSLDEDYSASWKGVEKPSYERIWVAQLPLVHEGVTIGRIQVRGRSEDATRVADIAELITGLRPFETQVLDIVRVHLDRAAARPAAMNETRPFKTPARVENETRVTV